MGNAITIDFACRIRSAENILKQDVETGSVLFNLETGIYIGLDDIGSQMWNELTTRPSVGDALGFLVDTYDVDPGALERDLVHFIEHLCENDLVTVESTATNG